MLTNLSLIILINLPFSSYFFVFPFHNVNYIKSQGTRIYYIYVCYFQTIVNRLKKEKLKEKRKAALKARLAKVKQRRLLQNGESAENAEQEVDGI